VVHAAPLTGYVGGGMDLGGRNCGPWPSQRKGFLCEPDLVLARFEDVPCGARRTSNRVRQRRDGLGWA
jgi:hypothetical protein